MGKTFSPLVILGLLCLSVSSCNAFSFLNGIGNDDDHLARARACLDNEDYECALEHYALVSDTYKNARESEIAFTIMAQNGVNFGAIIAAFGDSAGGKGLTRLATRLINATTSTTRGNYYTAYARNTNITGDNQLAGLVKFVSSISIAAAVLAENAGTDDIFDTNDITSAPTACATTEASCSDPSNNLLAGSGTFSSSGVTGTTNLGLLYVALQEADTALNAIGAGGIGSGASGLLSSLGASPSNTAAAQALRKTLLNQGVGTQ